MTASCLADQSRRSIHPKLEGPRLRHLLRRVDGHWPAAGAVLLPLGRTTLEIDHTVTVTDVARERALERGIAIARIGEDAVSAPGATPGSSDLADEVRRAVATALG